MPKELYTGLYGRARANIQYRQLITSTNANN